MRKDFFNNKGRLCGYWIDGIYRKNVDSTKHKLRVMNAYGIDTGIIEELKALGTKEIRIRELDTGLVHFIPFDQFVALGVLRNLETPQTFLPVHYFQHKEITK